ncbi:hypothetical protein [Streptomyces sp. NPDC047028]|uniref:hypothetical protein n=1 Tax=Streptomyces sp. NPDC047028 TaxID=3155793 RepID=UPI0033EF3E6A
MLALRLTRAGRPAVQIRRLLVSLASAGTGFLLLASLGYAMSHPQTPGAASLRLVWCVLPLAATVYFALAVARTDPATTPRPGLSAVGLGPARLMAISALTTALSCTLGSLVALLFFLHLRGDLTGMPFDGSAAQFLAAGTPLPVPAALTLLATIPVTASATVALALRPRDPRPHPGPRRPYGRFGAYGRAAAPETFGTYARFGTRFPRKPAGPTPSNPEDARAEDARAEGGAEPRREAGGSRAAGAMGVPPREGSRAWGSVGADGNDVTPGGVTGTETDPSTPGGVTVAEADLPAPGGVTPANPPAGLPWGVATLAAGLTVQAYAGHPAHLPALTTLPTEAVAVLIGWLLTALGLVLAAPGLTHLCGRLLQAVRPGALRLLAGRVLMAEATRVGRPLGVLCSVGAASYAMTALYDGPAPSFGPLSTLGALVVIGCTVATLLTAAVEARRLRADTTAALLRLGAPATMLRGAAALRAAVLLTVFGPLTLAIADLAALPLSR